MAFHPKYILNLQLAPERLRVSGQTKIGYLILVMIMPNEFIILQKTSEHLHQDL